MQSQRKARLEWTSILDTIRNKGKYNLKGEENSINEQK